MAGLETHPVGAPVAGGILKRSTNASETELRHSHVPGGPPLAPAGFPKSATWGDLHDTGASSPSAAAPGGALSPRAADAERAVDVVPPTTAAAAVPSARLKPRNPPLPGAMDSLGRVHVTAKCHWMSLSHINSVEQSFQGVLWVQMGATSSIISQAPYRPAASE